MAAFAASHDTNTTTTLSGESGRHMDRAVGELATAVGSDLRIWLYSAPLDTATISGGSGTMTGSPRCSA